MTTFPSEPEFVGRPPGEAFDCWRCPAWRASSPPLVVRGNTQGVCLLHAQARPADSWCPSWGQHLPDNGERA